MPQVAELDDRIAKCNKILNENPNSQIFAALSEAYRKKGDVDRAFRICQTGLKVHPDYGSAHVVMAKINLDKGLYDWAEMEILKVIELDGHGHATDLLMSEILIGRGEYAQATRILNKLQNVGVNVQQVKELLELAKRQPLNSKPAGEKEKPVQPILSGNKDADLTEPAQEPSPRSIPPKTSIKELMDSIIELPGVEGILLINKEGLVADSRWDDSGQSDIYGALAKDVESTIQTQIDICHFGKYENILIEAESCIINILPIKDNLLLIKTTMQINLGTLRLKLSSHLANLNEDFL